MTSEFEGKAHRELPVRLSALPAHYDNHRVVEIFFESGLPLSAIMS
jgi:hypothetical protein